MSFTYSPITIEPIGYVECEFNYPFEQPRQGEFANNKGRVKLRPHQNFEQALQDLEKFDRVWLIYHFDRNSSWRPKVSPPISANDVKRGLFATRSPHRPNGIGISAVKLLSIKGLTLEIADFDLLNKTPILDIKPYVPSYDSYSDSSTGWIEESIKENYKIEYSTLFSTQSEWIKNICSLDIKNFIEVQLANSPLDTKKRRVKGDSSSAIISFRTWRIEFSVDNDKRALKVNYIKTGYTTQELVDSYDKYGDKEVHNLFTTQNWSSLC
jgi:tRNA-Thr(GGU) m(6)t(6)A37 methyltransferase TsaA